MQDLLGGGRALTPPSAAVRGAARGTYPCALPLAPLLFLGFLTLAPPLVGSDPQKPPEEEKFLGLMQSILNLIAEGAAGK